MAELSLREFHIPIPNNITKDELRDICASYEILYNISLRTETEIKQKMLAKVDKAGLKDEQIKLELTKYAHEIMSSNPIRDWNQTELIKIVAKAQLQAIKSILEGK